MDNAHVFFIHSNEWLCGSLCVCVCVLWHCVSSTPNCRTNSFARPKPNRLGPLTINNQPTRQTLWYCQPPLKHYTSTPNPPWVLPACCHKYLCNWTHLFKQAVGQAGRGTAALHEVLGRDQSWFNYVALVVVYDLCNVKGPPALATPTN